MSKVVQVVVRCSSCRGWIPSPISFSNKDNFDSATLIGNELTCPSCDKVTACNERNMRLRYDDGGFVGDET